jgi:putative membrane protein
MMKTFTIAAVATALTVAVCVRAAEKAPTVRPEQPFLTEVASVGHMEVALGKMAQTHAASEQVKSFGQRMVDDHSKADEELKQLAARKSITLPAKMSPQHQKIVDRLSKLKGKEFDSAYMDEMVRGHEATVAKFRKEAASADDPDVKEFANKMLPTLEGHLQMAKDVSSGMGHATSGAPRHP